MAQKQKRSSTRSKKRTKHADESDDDSAFLDCAAAAGMSAKVVKQPKGVSGRILNNALCDVIANADGSRKKDFVLPPRQKAAAAPPGKEPIVVQDGPFKGVTLLPLPNWKYRLDPLCAQQLPWISSPDTTRMQSGEADLPNHRSKEEQHYRSAFPISRPIGRIPKSKTTGERMQWDWQVGEWLEPVEAEQRRADAAKLAAAEPEPQLELECAICGVQPGDDGPGGYPLTALDFDTDHDGVSDTSATQLRTIAAYRAALAAGTARFLCSFCHRRASLKQLHFDMTCRT